MKHGTKRRYLPFYSLAFCLLVSIHGVSAENRLFLLRGEVLHILDAADGREVGTRNALGNDLLLGTPGGKYVFVVNSATGLGQAVDFEDPNRAKDVDFSSEAPIAGLVFSPMGDTLYVVRANSNGITAFAHRTGEVSVPQPFNLPTSSAEGRLGLPVLNSRGTRLYRGGDDDLEYFLTSDRSRLKHVPATGGIRNWVMASGGRYLWGSGDKGWTIVDEARARVVKTIEIDGAELPHFSADGRSAWALALDGQVLVKLDVRRHRETGRFNLPEGAMGPASDGLGGVWVAAPKGLYRVEAKKNTAELAGQLPGEGAIAAFESVRLKQGQGFACF